MYKPQDIAANIKAEAKNKKIKLGEMFNDINVSPNTLSNMKKSMPSIETLALIADYLNCSIDDLCGRGQKNNASANKHRNAIINKVNSLPDKQLDRLLGYLEALAVEQDQ